MAEIQIDVPVSPEELEWRANYIFKLPPDLKDKTVIEFFSGVTGDNYRETVGRRGGRYFSVDLQESLEPGHIQGDAYEIVKTIPSHSADYILIQNPTWWGRWVRDRHPNWAWLTARQAPQRHDVAGLDQKTDFLINALKLLKEEPGSSLMIASHAGISESEYVAFYRALEEKMPAEEFAKWLITAERVREIADHNPPPPGVKIPLCSRVPHPPLAMGRIVIGKPRFEEKEVRVLRIVASLAIEPIVTAAIGAGRGKASSR